jgi:hypothetical protein
MKFYDNIIEEKTIKFYSTIKESDKRRFAGLEAQKIGHGGKSYICNLLGCDYKTIKKGIKDLDKEVVEYSERSRKQGGGRKLKIKDSNVNTIFVQVITEHTAGSPSNELVKWTYLNQEEIAEKMRDQGADVSRFVVKQLLTKYNFVKRKSQKKTH